MRFEFGAFPLDERRKTAKDLANSLAVYDHSVTCLLQTEPPFLPIRPFRERREEEATISDF
jgi:hypothetical protein